MSMMFDMGIGSPVESKRAQRARLDHKAERDEVIRLWFAVHSVVLERQVLDLSRSPAGSHLEIPRPPSRE